MDSRHLHRTTFNAELEGDWKCSGASFELANAVIRTDAGQKSKVWGMGQITEINNDIHFAPKDQKSEQKAQARARGRMARLAKEGSQAQHS